MRIWTRGSLKLGVGLGLTFAVLAAGVSVAGYSYYRMQSATVESDVRNQLSAIADLKVQKIVQWRQERVGDVMGIAASPSFAGVASRRGDTGALRQWLETYRKYNGYDEISIVSRNGVTLLTASGSPVSAETEDLDLCKEALESNGVVFSDLHRREDGHVYLDLAAPTTQGDGTVLLRTRADTYLYPLIELWPGPSSTAESLLVEVRDNRIVFLNNLRWGPSAALRLTVPMRTDLPATMAVRGLGGVRRGLDYRGVPVLAAVRSIPGTPWGLVAKVDVAEVQEPLRVRSVALGLGVVLLLAVSAVVFVLIWRMQRAREEHRRKAIEGRYAHLNSQVNDIILLYDDHGMIVEANDRAVDAYGYTREELLRMSIRDLRGPEAQEALSTAWRALEDNGYVVCEATHRCRDGTALPVEISARVLQWEGRRFVQSINRDVTERKRAEDELRKATRALRVLSACNQAVVRASDEDSLYRDVCEAITGVGDYPMAWIGFPEAAPGKPVRLVSAAGRGRGYLNNVQVGWGEDAKGQGVVGVCIRTRQVVACTDIAHDPRMVPWREQAARHGFAAVIALPLWCGGEVFGALAIYAGEAEAFHTRERELLEELAGDISFGVESRRRRLEQQRVETELRQTESEFRTLFDNVGDAVFIVDLQGRFREVNRVACERLGYTREELLNLGVRDIDDTSRGPRSPSELRAAPDILIESVHVRRDGSRFPVEINSHAFEYHGALALLSVVRDITERRHAEAEVAKRTAELERARSEAEEANRAKSQFLAHMSHEIRTPLNGIIGMAGLLLETSLNEEQKEFAETIHRSAGALLSLVNDLLDISRIEAGRVDLDPAPFDLVACLEAAGELMAPQARARGLDYVFEANVRCRRVYGDSGRLRQIVLNLLSNAIKFTERGYVKLSLSAECGGDHPIYGVAVEDTGPGIAEDHLPLLFRSFSQLDSSLARKHEGAGLGLAISRQLAELMGGTITVSSQVGRGSIFLVSIPLQPIPDPDLVLAPETVREALAGGDRLRRVLLVEDNVVNQRLGLRTLEKLGCHADLAANGREAVEMALKSSYDLILMDCRMPEMDGYTATREIRRQQQDGMRTPIVAMTAHAVVGAREECLEAGMDDYVSKPVAPGELERVLLRWGA
ncbi:MAG TPA: PAS domain S-box protein [Bryobacteraceae bacterium]|nr:PAS domain S-box protein [Bryobacteraceae bacterium]